MSNAYHLLQQEFQKIAQLEHAITFLQWDQLVMMPAAGNEQRAKSIAELTAMHHELLCSTQLGELLQQAINDRPDEQIQRRSLEEMARVRNQAVCVPVDLVKAKSLAGSVCEHGWRNQRGENDWKGFLANFKEVVNLCRQEAQARQAQQPDTFATPYDALLDLYCTGDSSEFIGEVFTLLKKKIPTIIERAIASQPPKPKIPQGPFPAKQQEKLSRRLMEILGFDFNKGRLDVSLHPFSTGGRGDQRITTRFRQTEFIEALLATAHETGHASYENGLPDQWDGLPIGHSRNMCIHESQSLLFEKQLFLSTPFLDFFTAEIHSHLPQIQELTSEEIFRASARVEPSLIRVEADEATYPMHIILRFEIEKALINKELEADDLPEIWDTKMQNYLGLSTAGNYTDGCLQDIHWTDGSFGYFPSYTMGALNAAQLFAALKKDVPQWSELLRQGDTTFIRQWLGRMIWSKGSSLDSQDLLINATGEQTNPNYFIDHLKNRYISTY